MNTFSLADDFERFRDGKHVEGNLELSELFLIPDPGLHVRWAFCSVGATIVSGAVAERVKNPSYAALAFFMTGFIYPVVVAWTWGGGWLSTLFGVGYMDFAGSGAILKMKYV